MLTPAQMAEAFDRNRQIIQRQAAGLSHADSLAQAPVRANCMNWLIGHILTGRNDVLTLLGAPPALDPAVAGRYERESEPVVDDGPGVLPLDELLAALDRSQEQIAAALAQLNPADCERELAFFGRRSRPLSWWVSFFYFHDTYHTGQTEIARQLAGKDDMVI